MRYLLIFATLLLSACSGLTPAEQAPSLVENYQIDPVHSSVLFQIRHLGVGPFSGRFNDVQGSLVLDHGNTDNSQIEVKVQASNVDTADEGRDKHLRSEEFFNAPVTPEISFRSTSFELTGKGTYRVHGELTLLGITQPVTANARYIGTIRDQPGFGTRTGMQAHLTIRRSSFGMTALLGKLGDEVQLEINIEGVLQE